MENGIQEKKFISMHILQMGFCSVNCYSSATKSERFDALQILFLEVIFVHIVTEILPGQT